MGLGIQGRLEVSDDFTAPEYYYSHVAFEDAGDGNVRVARYVMRKGILVPVVSTVSSAASLIKLGQDVYRFARGIMLSNVSDDALRLPDMKVH